MSLPVGEVTTAPVPASVIDNIPALLPMVTVPVAAPAEDGANVTFSATVCPGVNTVFAAAPLTRKPVPATTTLDSVTFTFPLFLRVTPADAELPTKTLAKSKWLVLELSMGVAADAVPLAEIINGDPGALLRSEIDPAMFPAEVGANTTLNVVLWPAAMFIGMARPEVPKPAPVTFAAEMVTPALPAFCSIIVCELLAPAVTMGKLALAGVAESCACGLLEGGGVLGLGEPPLLDPFDPETIPAQPFPKTQAANTKVMKHLTLTSTDRLARTSDPCPDPCSAIVAASLETRSQRNYWSDDQTK